MDPTLRRLLSFGPERGAGVPAPARRALLALAGVGCGLSPAFYGYFDLSTWGPIGVVLLALLVGVVLAAPRLPGWPAIVAVTALFLFAAWCLLSMGWAESADRALVEGDRWLVYAVFALLLVFLVVDRLDAEVFVAAATVGILCIAVYDLVVMLGGDGPDLFGETRLLEPLGYVNGLGGFFLIGTWPLLALAERQGRPFVAGLAAAAATLLAALVVLTESRGTLFAYAASAAILLAIFPNRVRRGFLQLALVGALALIWGPLSDVTGALPPGRRLPEADTIEHAAQWALLAAAGVGVLWSLCCLAVEVASERSRGAATTLSRAGGAALIGAAAVAVIVAFAAVGDPAARLSDEYDSFTQLEQVEPGGRLTAGGGNRYDYWRIAWRQFTDEPLKGLGAGNFDTTYFRERQTPEDVRQAHSIELQALGETGLVGALLIASFVALVFLGAVGRALAARGDPTAVTVGVAATGTFVVWLAQTSVDWLHLIPGITGIALGAAAVLLIPDRGPGEGDGRLLPLPAGLALVALCVVAMVLVGRPTLAQHYLGEAQAELDRDPAAALASAERSLSLNPEAVQGYYAKAAALARANLYRQSKSALREAIEREPHNFVSWALLGDLELRRGDYRRAMSAYGQASGLNPRDRELRALRSDRALLVRLHRRPGEAAALLEVAAAR